MGTSAIYSFSREEKNPIVAHIYGQFDGDPGSTILKIQAALEYAWKLPRYEPDEFAAAFIRANKIRDGGFRIIIDPDSLGMTFGRYHIYMKDEVLHVHMVLMGNDYYNGPMNDFNQEECDNEET